MKGKEGLSAAKRHIEALEETLLKVSTQAAHDLELGKKRERALKEQVTRLESVIARGVNDLADERVTQTAEQWAAKVVAAEAKHREEMKAIGKIITANKGNRLSTDTWTALNKALKISAAELHDLKDDNRAVRRVTPAVLNRRAERLHEGGDKPAPLNRVAP